MVKAANVTPAVAIAAIVKMITKVFEVLATAIFFAPLFFFTLN